jgi:hypothetical protein
MDRFTARRKLLRGSLAAPVVLTTASPAVLAQTSFLACITRGGNEGATGFAAEQCGGNVYRVEVDVFSFVPVPQPGSTGGVGGTQTPGGSQPPGLGGNLPPGLGGSQPPGQVGGPGASGQGGVGLQSTDPYAGKLFAFQRDRNGNSTGLYDSTDGHFKGIKLPEGYQAKPSGKSWQLVYFNQHGEEVGYGFVSNSGTPVSCSCWTSFNFKQL